MKVQAVKLLMMFENSSKLDMPKRFTQFLDEFIVNYHF